MPDRETMRRAAADKREGKSASTQAGEFVREEIEHIREGKHGARSTEQAIAIGLSKARRAGVDMPPPNPDTTSPETQKRAAKDAEAAKHPGKRPSRTRSRATRAALAREGTAAASTKSLSSHAETVAKRRGAAARSTSAKKASVTKGAKGRSAAGKKAARTRAKNGR